MDCERSREAISARLDGEDPGIPKDGLEDHLDACEVCREFAAEAADLNRFVRVSEAPVIPDLTQTILQSLRPVELDWSRQRWRVVLVALAGAKLAAAVPGLVTGLDGGEALHAVREVAAWETALAVALLLAAWQPVRAWGLLPLVGVATVVMISVALMDLVAGQATVVGEAHHVIEVVGLVALWRLVGPIGAVRAVPA